MTKLERKELARNIRHRLADMFGSQYGGALDAAMDEMLLDEIDKFFDVDQLDLGEEATPEAVEAQKDDGKIAWPLRKRDDGDAYLKGIMERD